MKKQNNLTKPSQTKEKAKEKYHNFDGHWKEMIQEFIQEFIEYFLPELYPNVDFNYPPEFLDTELQNILESIGTNKRVLDKLVKVRLKNGQFKWLLIHIEVQSYFEKLFAERMFLMYAMIFAKFRQKILGIAIYTNKKIPKQFDKYEALERNIDLDKISRLLIFVDGIMQLSKDLQEEYKTFVSQQLKFKETMVATSPNAKLITEFFDTLKKRANRLAKQDDEQYIENIVAASPNSKVIIEFFDTLKKEANRLAKKEAETLLIHTLYFEKSWTIDQIADLLKIEKMTVQSVIDEQTHNQ